MSTLLAFDTATERMSVALTARGEVRIHEAAGGAQASAALIPAIFGLLADAGLSLSEVDAIAFGRGPGAFTGLRTACAVAQGLAMGAGKLVLPLDTLLAVAEDARAQKERVRVWVAMDARMDEIYAAHYAYEAGHWTTLVTPMLISPELLTARWQQESPEVVAGSALDAFGERLQTGTALRVPQAMPRAHALVPLAQALWQAGGAVDPALALPVYVRDKVAQTTAEREALRASREGHAAEARP
jgi:tRNA threonylcarbamoyladenosine biosynthesis protein TsaB